MTTCSSSLGALGWCLLPISPERSYSLATTGYLADGNGGFFAPVSLPLIEAPYRGTSGDFNRDGLRDVAISHWSSLTMFLGDGIGGFSPLAPMGIAPNTRWAEVVDFDGDGADDLVSFTTMGWGFTPIDPNGILGPTSLSPLESFINGAVVEDFNEDGRLDAVFLLLVILMALATGATTLFWMAARRVGLRL